MSRNNKIFCIVVIILIVILLIYKNKISKSSDDLQGISEDGVIENEDYYKEKMEEYEQLSDEYDNLVNEYAEERFTSDEKKIIEDYQEQMTAAVQEGDKDKKKQISDKYVETYNKYMEKEFTNSQLSKIKKIRNKMEKLEEVVDEYSELLIKQEEKERQEGLETLEDGTILSKREGIISEKEYNGVLFTDIELTYNPETKKTNLKMNANNKTNNIKQSETVELKFSGRTEALTITKIEEILPNDYLEMNVPIDANLTDTESFEILKYNEDDFKIED